MITNIILAVLVLFVIVGLARPALKDFNVPSIAAIAFVALVIGLSFIPSVRIGNISFNIGALLFFIVPLALFIFRGKLSSKGTAFLISLILAGILYAATQVFELLGGGYMSSLNVVYAVIIGGLAMLFTRNAKYSFISAVTAFFIAGIALQAGADVYNLTVGFQNAVIAGTTALLIHGIAARVTSRPGKYSYYYEIGKLKD